MCLAIPAKIVSEPNDIQMAEVDILGVKRHICLMMTPSAQRGDHVLVHAGFAIQVIDEAFAAETLAMLSTMGIKTAAELEAEMAMAGDEPGSVLDGKPAEDAPAFTQAPAPAAGEASVS